MRFRHHAPHPDLHDLVQGYWELDDLYLAKPVKNADLPEGMVRLMFSAQTVLTGPAPETLRALPPVTLTQFSLHSQESMMQGQFRMLVAELYPWAARQLLGWQADAPPDRLNTAINDSTWGREVVALLRLGEWNAAREALETHLIGLARRRGGLGAGVQAAWHIYQSLGTVQVAELAETLNISRSTLERQFAQQIGVSAKTLARVVRFDAANTRIRLDPSVPMADLTFELGFFDQAHLINEFRRLSGMTPSRFAAVAVRHRHTVDLNLFERRGDSYLELELPPGFGLGRR